VAFVILSLPLSTPSVLFCFSQPIRLAVMPLPIGCCGRPIYLQISSVHRRACAFVVFLFLLDWFHRSFVIIKGPLSLCLVSYRVPCSQGLARLRSHGSSQRRR